MSDYSKTTNFTTKDGLASGDPNKVIKGSEHDTEYDNISTAVATKANKVASATNTRIVTMAADGDIQDGGNATLSAGAITAVSFTGPLTGDVTGDLLDDNGNEALTVATTASAVNEVTLTNAATGNDPALSSTGDDTNIGLDLVSKGTGTVKANSKRDLEKGVIQMVSTESSTATSTAAAIPYDNTVPTTAEGTSLYSLSITPLYTDSVLEFSFDAHVSHSANGAAVHAIFTLVDTTGATVEYTGIQHFGSAGGIKTVNLRTEIASPGTSSTSYEVRYGSAGVGTVYINSDGGTAVFGGNMVSNFTVKEIRK